MRHFPIYRTGLGQDSHRFLPDGITKRCIIGGIFFDEVPGFKANSDGDVILHAIMAAITTLTGVPILGKLADELLEKQGITDSSVYLKEALALLSPQKIVHVALALEASRPKFLHRLDEMRLCIAELLHIEKAQVGITATTGEALTDFGCGDGVQCLCLLTTVEEEPR